MGAWFVFDMTFTDFLRAALRDELDVPVIQGEPSFERIGVSISTRTKRNRHQVFAYGGTMGIAASPWHRRVPRGPRVLSATRASLSPVRIGSPS